MTRQDFHKFLYDVLDHGGSRWTSLRLFRDHCREVPLRMSARNARTLQNRFGGTVKADSPEDFTADVLEFYETVFCDDRLKTAMEQQEDFLAMFHFGPKDDETSVAIHYDARTDVGLWVSINYHRFSSTFVSVDADGTPFPDENRFETLEDTGYSREAIVPV